MSSARKKTDPASDLARVHLPVRAVPGAARTAAVAMLGEALKIRVAAPPEDGAANQALCLWVKKALGAADRARYKSPASSEINPPYSSFTM